MATRQSSIRFSLATRQQLQKLQQLTGMNRTEIVSRAIDRMAQDRYRMWRSSQANDYDPCVDQDGDYGYEKWIASTEETNQ